MLLNRVHTAIAYEMLNFVKANPNALGTEKADDAAVPSPVKKYMTSVKPADFMNDIRLLTSVIGGSDQDVSKSDLFKALAEFWAINFATKLDHMTTDFYLLSQAKQCEVADKTINSKTLVAEMLKELLVTNSYQELANGIGSFVKLVAGAPHVLVQSPREIDYELKKKIRNQLREEHGQLAFPVFQINKNLIGGLRIFVGGNVTDHSWLGSINYITSSFNK